MKVVFRVDASIEIGSGHVIRCLALARPLRELGAEIFFISRDLEGNLHDRISSEGFSLSSLKDPEILKPSQDQETSAEYAGWLAVPWQADAAQTINAIGSKDIDWLVVDHYALDKRWEVQLRPYTKKIMVIDDLADRPHDCNLIVDHNFISEFEKRYRNITPDTCICFLGPRYALIDSEYSRRRSSISIRTGPIRQILVSFGGYDPSNLTQMTTEAFIDLRRSDIRLDVVINSKSKHLDTINELIVPHSNITLHKSLPTLASLTASADLVIGAGGVTTWERCCLGAPALVITMAENQIPIARHLDRQKIIRLIGDHKTVSRDDVFGELKKIVQTANIEEWSSKCMSLVDGKGINRVTDLLTLTVNTCLKVRRARHEDESLLLGWVNDPLVRKNAFEGSLISPESHHRWLVSKLKDKENCMLFVIETLEELPIGQVRFECNGTQWEIHYGLWAPIRGLGLGTKMLAEALSVFRQTKSDVTLFGRVKRDNFPSRRIFEALGFKKKSEEHFLVYHQST